MAGDVLGIGVSALKTFQTALATTSNNVSNMNTEGYSRQRVEIQSLGSVAGGDRPGVGVQDVTRMYDDFLRRQVNYSESEYYYADSYATMTDQLDALVGNEQLGLTGAFSNFSSALNTLRSEPTSGAARADVIAQAQLVQSRATNLANQFESTRQIVNGQVQDYTAALNDRLQNLVEINKTIKALSSSGGSTSEVFDARDLELKKVSEYLKVDYSIAADGQASIFTPAGLSLVNEGFSNQFTTALDPYGQEEMRIYMTDTAGANIDVTDKLTSGKIGATVAFRDESLKTAERELTRMAVSFSELMNVQQSVGYTQNVDSSDPTGETSLAGGDMFESFAGEAYFNRNNQGGLVITFEAAKTAGDVQATKDAVSEFVVASYQIRYDGTNYVATNPETKESMTIARSGVAGATVTDATTGATSTFDGTGILNSLTLNGIVYSFNEISPPAYGDSFRIEPFDYQALKSFTVKDGFTATDVAASSTNVIADVANSANITAMIDIQQEKLLDGGKYKLDARYTQIISSIGAKASAMELAKEAAQVKQEQIGSMAASTAGVNSDEEAADLIKWQQGYQAASRIITTAQDMFDGLLAILR